MAINRQIQRALVYKQESITSTLIYSRRSTLEFAVYPDSTVIIRVPSDIDAHTLDEKIAQRLSWIFKKIHFFKERPQKDATQNYTDGTEHPYLGKHYPLKILHDTENTLIFSQDAFCVTCQATHTQEIVHALLMQWYFTKAHTNFAQALERCWQTFGMQKFDKPYITIRKMKTRWGSLSGKGRMTLNLELIKTPQECIDYVIMHELCHLVHRNHSADFYALLASKLPHWKDLKVCLESAAL